MAPTTMAPTGRHGNRQAQRGRRLDERPSPRSFSWSRRWTDPTPRGAAEGPATLRNALRDWYEGPRTFQIWPPEKLWTDLKWEFDPIYAEEAANAAFGTYLDSLPCWDLPTSDSDAFEMEPTTFRSTTQKCS